jgi:hypothetical protein
MKIKILLMPLSLLTLLLISVPATTSSAEPSSEPLVFSTWDIFEVDKCASIWLIKRFIDPKARIVIYPKGDAITEGIPFDTPDAKFRRYQNASTYETFMRHYKIQNDRLLYLGKIVHDIEVNTWGKKAMKETRHVQNEVNTIITDANTSDEIIEKSLLFFDAFYSESKQ